MVLWCVISRLVVLALCLLGATRTYMYVYTCSTVCYTVFAYFLSHGAMLIFVAFFAVHILLLTQFTEHNVITNSHGS